MSNGIPYDDIDPNVIYTGNWFKGGSAHEFGKTTHGTNQANAAASFAFTGTSISVYGTISNFRTARNAAISTYSVDGSPPVTFIASQPQDTQYQQLFFHTDNLQDGNHNLIITCTNDQSFFWLDYLEVNGGNVPAVPSATGLFSSSSLALTATDTLPPTGPAALAYATPGPSEVIITVTSYADIPTTSPVPTVSSSPSLSTPDWLDSWTTFDDMSNSIVYDGVWFFASAPEANEGSYHGTVDEGATATLQFVGNRVAVYGTLPQSTASRKSWYTLDGGISISVTPEASSVNALYQVVLFQSVILPEGNHTLVIEAGPGDIPLYLDFIRTSSASSPTTNTVTISPNSFSSSTSVGSTVSTSSTSQSSSSGSSSGNHAGYIAGGVFAALVFIAIPVLAFFWYRRRRAMRAPSRQAPAVPDPSWVSDQRLPNEKAAKPQDALLA